MALSQALRILQTGEPLEPEHLKRVIDAFLQGQVNDVEAGAILALLTRNGLSAADILLFARVFGGSLNSFDPGKRVLAITDLGWSERHSFHVYTATCFVVAACGIPVVNQVLRVDEHNCSKFNLLQALQIPISSTVESLQDQLGKYGLAYFDPELAAPQLASMIKWSRSLGQSNVISMVLPLLHPVKDVAHLIAVAREEDTDLYAEAFSFLGLNGSFVFGEDGTAEVSLTTRTKITQIHGQQVDSYIFDPRRHGFNWTSVDALKAGSVPENIKIIDDVLKHKKPSVYYDLVLLNAAFALKTYQETAQLDQCIDQARQAMETGAAWQLLQRLQVS